jgi:hypothetical protein
MPLRVQGQIPASCACGAVLPLSAGCTACRARGLLWQVPLGIGVLGAVLLMALRMGVQVPVWPLPLLGVLMLAALAARPQVLARVEARRRAVTGDRVRAMLAAKGLAGDAVLVDIGLDVILIAESTGTRLAALTRQGVAYTVRNVPGRLIAGARLRTQLGERRHGGTTQPWIEDLAVEVALDDESFPRLSVRLVGEPGCAVEGPEHLAAAAVVERWAALLSAIRAQDQARAGGDA